MTENQKKLVTDNIRLMEHYVQSRLAIGTIPKCFEDEFVSEVALKFCHSAMCFDESRGFRFSTYAYSGFNNCLRTIKGRKAVRYWRNNFIPRECVESLVENHKEDHKEVVKEELVRLVNRAGIDGRNLLVLKDYYFSGDTMEKIGIKFGISKERVSQILRESLKRLRRVVSRDKLEVSDFLTDRENYGSSVSWT